MRGLRLIAAGTLVLGITACGQSQQSSLSPDPATQTLVTKLKTIKEDGGNSLQQNLAYHAALDQSTLPVTTEETAVQQALGKSSTELYRNMRDLFAKDREWIYSQKDNPNLRPSEKCNLLGRITLHQEFLKSVAPTIINMAVRMDDSYDTDTERQETVKIGLEEAVLLGEGLENTKDDISRTMSGVPCPQN